MRFPRGGKAGWLVLVILAVNMAAAAPADKTTRDKVRRPTLDDLTAHTELERRPDGSIQWKRSFKKAIPWDEYLAALEAEGPIEYDFTGDVPVMRRRTGGTDTLILPDEGTIEPEPLPEQESTSTVCTPPDDDYDGDGFTLTTPTQDLFPLRRGEYVADRPRVAAQFTSFIEPGIDVLYSGDINTTFEHTRFFQDDLITVDTVSETREIKRKFNSTLAFKWVTARGAGPILSLTLDAGSTFERSHDYKWTRTKTRTVEEKFTDIRNKKETNHLSFGPAAGRVSGQVTITNVSDYAIDVDVSNVRIAVVAYSPFTGAKYALGDVALAGTFLLGFGAGNDSASSFVQLSGLNTFDMMNRLAEGWVFDMEMASYTANDHATGTNLTSIISRMNQRNSRLSIHYGDASPRAYGQVSVFQPAGACLTGRDLLTQFVGAGNVEFERMADGLLVVRRIFHRTNQFADRDFDTLTPAEQAQYGRWIVGFDYYARPDTTFDLENVLLAPEDKVYFYFVTAADFVQPPPPADEVAAFSVANDGTSPASTLVTPVSTYDTVELSVTNAFTLESPYSQPAGNISNPNCGVLYNATWFGHRVTTDSRFQNITIPNVDWYGVQVDFGAQGWRSLTSIMADPASQGTVTQFRGFPHYDYKVKFLVTPAMLGSYPTRNLQVRSANPRQTFTVGYDGYDVLGRFRSCRWTSVGGFHHNTGSVSVWYKLDNTDGDLDGFYAATSTGLDFDDAHARRFPFAPEHLDGLDNDGDGQVDEEPLECPASLQAYEEGTCRLDNRMGWYSGTPATVIERRFRNADGTTTGWETIGSGLSSYTFIMTSEPAVTHMEVRTTFQPSGGGPSFSGVNVIYREPGGSVPLFTVGPEFQAEAGRIAAPMRVDTIGPDTFVHTPAGSTGHGSASADYRINVTASGDYQIWTRVRADNAGDDSIFVTLYDVLGRAIPFGFGSQAHFRFEAASPGYTYGAFGWTRVGHWNPYVTPEQNLNPITWHLTPGIYLMRVQPRELGSKLDKLRVDRLCPDADADGYTTCAGDCNDANPNVRPGRSEVCSNSLDDDCDGYVNEGCGGGGSPIFKKVME